MERLEAKTVKGKTYYYYSHWGWRDGRCRRLWQKYLGKLEDIVAAVQGRGFAAQSAEVFDFGLPAAVWAECRRQRIAEEVDAHRPKRRQGLSIGTYMALAAVNRAVEPASKRAFGEWFEATCLRRTLPAATPPMLSSQRFWDHLDMLSVDDAKAAWTAIINGVLKREGIQPAEVCYDGTNFYTFISTFNQACTVARRGKNKQGRGNLRQVSYALFCDRESHLPLYYDVYQGNQADATQFPLMITRFREFLATRLNHATVDAEGVTVVFDKGNNSAENMALLDTERLHFVGALKATDVPALATISNASPTFISCTRPSLEGIKYFATAHAIHGKSRQVVVTYNPELFRTQWLTLLNDIEHATQALSTLQQRLADRANGLIKGGRAPTQQSIATACKEILSRQFLKTIFTLAATSNLQLEFSQDQAVLANIAATVLGQKILFSSRLKWHPEQIIDAYHGQYVIEHAFKEMKDRRTGSWWPLNHWTDQNIHLHGFYCTLAILLKTIIHRRVKLAGIQVSMPRLLKELESVKEVVLLGGKPAKGGVHRTQTVLTRLSDVQARILRTLGLEKIKSGELG